MNFETLQETSHALQMKKVTSEGLTEAAILAIKTKDAAVGGYSDLLFETARAEARASDERTRAGRRKSLVDGIPIAIKDLIDTSPAVCRAGLDHLSNYRPKQDAPVVSKLREAGAVILGVTESDPGAFSTDTAKVINPMAPDRIAGGSSGGSAAVVASGLAFAALGTDTGGSIRIPASCCSIYGFKPTWGRVDATGVRPLASSLDHVGPMARCVRDLEMLQEVIDPTFIKLPDHDPFAPVKLGLANPYSYDACPEVLQYFADAVKELRDKGITFADVGLPKPDDVLQFHMVNLPKEAADYHLAHFPNDWPDYPEIARETIEIGQDIDKDQLAKAEAERSMVRRLVDQALSDVDAIIVPTMPVAAPQRDKDIFQLNGSSHSRLETTIRYTSLFNQTGHPVVSMPIHVLDDGRSVSAQIVGRAGSDEIVLQIAKYLELMISLKIDYAEYLDNNMEAIVEKRKNMEVV